MTHFWLYLLEGKVLHKETWVAVLLGTLFGAQDRKNVKFLCTINIFMYN